MSNSHNRFITVGSSNINHATECSGMSLMMWLALTKLFLHKNFIVSGVQYDNEQWHTNKAQLPNIFCLNTQINYLLRTDTKIVNVFLEYESQYFFSMSSSSMEKVYVCITNTVFILHIY